MPLEIRGAHFLIRSAQLVRGTRLEWALMVPLQPLTPSAAYEHRPDGRNTQLRRSSEKQITQETQHK